MYRYTTSLIGMGLLILAQVAQANLILNGDFENNSAGASIFNMSNAQYNATVANSTAFGTAQEIDLVTGNAFGIVPQSGNWKVGIHTQVNPANFDALSLDISGSLVSGALYDLQFFGAQLGGQGELGAIEVGLSTIANAFGTLIFSGSPLSDVVWTQFNQTFAAPNNGAFLTVRSDLVNTSTYNFVDNFSLVRNASVPEPTTLLLLGLGLAGLGFVKRRLH